VGHLAGGVGEPPAAAASSGGIRRPGPG